MSDVVISARDVSKSYAISHRGPSATTLAEALAGFAKNPLRRERCETFWALRDVSFDVRRGEVIGIVGRNGAGKSTLLKILSEITGPTRGEIELYGRVGSLLEVGTGFHPELTGRENIFLNGAILGMRRREIARRFEEIVEFSGVAQFLDTPVKRYSSGMYVRLAFAVAAHLEPEILIVDEVLAVGDAQFQQKCLGKMGEVASGGGRTVIFVSHNMAALSALCSRTMHLQNGRMAAFGPTSQIVSEYLALGTPSRYENTRAEAEQPPTFIRRAWIETARAQLGGCDSVQLSAGDEFTLCVEIANRSHEPVEFVASFYDHLRRPLWYFTNSLFGHAMISRGDRVQIRLSYRLPRLSVPSLIVDLAVMVPSGYPPLDLALNALTVSIVGEETASRTGMSDQFPIVNVPGYSILNDA